MNDSFLSVHNFSIQREFTLGGYSDLVPYLFQGHGSYLRSSSVPIRMRVHCEHLRMPSFDNRNAADDNVKSTEGGLNKTSRLHIEYESTRDGDVAVVEPSFDAEENDGRGPRADMKYPCELERRISPMKEPSAPPKRGHTRNLSEHFNDATTLSNDPALESTHGVPQAYTGYRGPPPVFSSAAGQKHRRVFSGDVSNPPEAHRRINSIGNSATVQRRPFIQERQHQRVDSAGLDILTAAADDVSREELAAAAGERSRDSRSSFDSNKSGPRRSPVEMVTYDHSSGGPHRPSARPPPRSYLPGPPPSTGYYPPSHGYSHPSYPPPAFYPHPPSHGYQRTVPSGPPGGYPVQYARGPEHYPKHSTHGPLHQPALERLREDGSTPPKRYSERRDRGPAASEKGAMTPPHPVPPSQWRGGSTQGVHTYVTAVGVGEASRSIQPSVHQRRPGPNTETSAPPIDSHHHRKTSSISSWAPQMSVFMGPPGEVNEHPLKGHHRSTSSSVSFLGLDVGGLDNTDATFLKNLHASTGTSAPAFSSIKSGAEPQRTQSGQSGSEVFADDGTSKLALGGTSKRVRRKCTVGNCDNRVVQGGLCIAHGAKRKQCKFSGCNKNVKKAGLCSTHGPARKRCDTDDCNKVAVQGGKCIAHGAKKKLCSMDSCTKQAILSGMCKKHHDQSRKEPTRVPPPPGEYAQHCKVIAGKAARPVTSKQSRVVKKPTHTRGLSLFQEMTPDLVGNLLGDEGPPAAATSHRHRSTFSRDFGNLY